MGTKVALRYAVDVCPAPDDRLLIETRGLRVIRVNDQPPSEPASSAFRQVEVTSVVPAMVVGRSGAFLDTANTSEMLDRVAALHPGQDISMLRTAQQGGYFKGLAASRWRTWVELWLAFDPKLGNPQNIQGPDRGGFTVTFEGLGEGRRAHFTARNSITGERARTFGDSVRASNPDIAAPVRDVRSALEVETEWPELRPWRVHTSEVVRFVSDTQKVLAEEHEYRFDWNPVDEGAADCKPMPSHDR
jgi:hypothetical protein